MTEPYRKTTAASHTIQAVARALAGHRKKAIDDPRLSPAAVMVLLYHEGGEYNLVLNRRSNSVAEHKGEIAFPGGRMSEDDKSMLETALRETHEEMGVHPEDVEVLGELDDVATISDYRVSPYVGVVPPEYPFQPDSREVAEVLMVPLSALEDEGNRRDELRFKDGVVSKAKSYAYDGNLVFGATAAMVTSFLEVLGTSNAAGLSWRKP